MKMCRWLILFLVALFQTSVPAAFGETKTLGVTVSAGKLDRANAPAVVALTLPDGLAKNAKSVKLTGSNGANVVGQITVPSLLANPAQPPAGSAACELHFIAPAMKAGETQTYSVTISDEPSAVPQFVWTDTPKKYNELTFDGRPVLRYMYEPMDESTKERRGETYKVYHHVYDPKGTRLVTKGPGGLFPHHRGLYFGFNRISYEVDGQNKTADTWHCNNGESQSHEGFLASEVGPVLGRHRLAIDWHGKDGKVFATEQREMTAYNTVGGTLIEFASRLTSKVGKVKLDGDPQHAGFQFRASQEVPDKTAKQTYYLRPDGQDKPGSFRNWPANKQHVDLPWNALSFVLGDQRYTCCYLDRPQNPKEARFSERDYGRFGSYFEYELDTNKPLDLNYRIWLQEGEQTVEGVQAIANNFVTPVVAEARGG